jgi:Domain of unknown function (DUF4372)
MYLGKTLFAQAMDFLPWKTFHRIVNRYGGDHRTRSLSCAEQFRVMAFAQLTYRMRRMPCGGMNGEPSSAAPSTSLGIIWPCQ